MLYAQERGVRRLIVETDCQVLLNLWGHRASQRSEIDPVLHQMEVLSWSFEDFVLIFINRSCNKVAHEFAKLVSRDYPVVEWRITPPVLRGIIADDCNPHHM